MNSASVEFVEVETFDSDATKVDENKMDLRTLVVGLSLLAVLLLATASNGRAHPPKLSIETHSLDLFSLVTRP